MAESMILDGKKVANEIYEKLTLIMGKYYWTENYHCYYWRSGC